VDSAVAWGLKDLRIRNPFPEPVRVRGDAQLGKLRVGLWSGTAPVKVELRTDVEKGKVGTRHEPLLIKRTRVVHWLQGPRTDVVVLRYPAEPKD
jgi:vancomycin resistance protein YoaR